MAKKDKKYQQRQAEEVVREEVATVEEPQVEEATAQVEERVVEEPVEEKVEAVQPMVQAEFVPSEPKNPRVNFGSKKIDHMFGFEWNGMTQDF